MVTFRNLKGFTLIELMIVMAIIAILAAIAIPVYRANMFKSKLIEVTNSMGTVASAVATYYQENNQWPPNNGNATDIGARLGVYVPTNRANWSTGGPPITITAIITNISAEYPTIDGCTIQLIASTSANGTISWSWGGDLAPTYMPKN